MSNSVPSSQQLLFARAVISTLDLWPALRIAVEEEWGGPESREKAEYLVSAICDNCDEQSAQQKQQISPPDAEDLEELIESYLSYEFNVRLEDESISYIAQRITSLWQTIFLGDASSAQLAVEQLEHAKASLRGKKIAAQVQAQEGEDNVSSSDEADSDAPDAAGDHSMDVDDEPRHEGPVVDEDGFTLVAKGSRRK